MHWDNVERVGRERQAALLAEADDLHLLSELQAPFRPRLARWLHALANRLERVKPSPCPQPTCPHKPA